MFCCLENSFFCLRVQLLEFFRLFLPNTSQAFEELGRPQLKARTDFGTVSARVPVLSALGKERMSKKVKTPDMNKVLRHH